MCMDYTLCFSIGRTQDTPDLTASLIPAASSNSTSGTGRVAGMGLGPVQPSPSLPGAASFKLPFESWSWTTPSMYRSAYVS